MRTVDIAAKTQRPRFLRRHDHAPVDPLSQDRFARFGHRQRRLAGTAEKKPAVALKVERFAVDMQNPVVKAHHLRDHCLRHNRIDGGVKEILHFRQH